MGGIDERKLGVETVISGGQTGVDRAAFDFALAHGIEIAGFVPKGRNAEDGPLSPSYRNVTETESTDPSERTRLNIENADATLIISRGPLAGGSRLTHEMAERSGKPFIHIDLNDKTVAYAADAARRWLEEVSCSRLNIAGPRASEDELIYTLAKEFLTELFK